jgi:hypothetical protein
MKKALAIACSTVLALIVANLGTAAAADMYTKAPPPPVGKGKAPIGKGKGKAPVLVSRY